jgi:GrpB-like predicted nucleotidyltransferase (UPF0157 family)
MDEGDGGVDGMRSRQQTQSMLLVGGQRVLAAEGDSEELLRFYGGLFARLAKEVRHTGDLTRYVGYQSAVGGEYHLHFFGIEVERIEDIPAGMVAWDLRGDTWTVWQAGGGRDVLVAEERVAWLWCERSPAGRWTGEFAARLPISVEGGGTAGRREVWVSANAPVGVGLEADGSGDAVYLVDDDPSWPQQYREFARWLVGCLGADVALRVEHYGSTAIPGIPAKPIIDVLVEIPSFARAKQRAVPRLDGPEWEYWWYAGHMTFIKRRGFMGPRTHHVHMAPRGHRLWEGIAFRDYLRSHPDEAARYAALKRELAAAYRADRERYTQAKTAFVQEVLAKALKRGTL